MTSFKQLLTTGTAWIDRILAGLSAFVILATTFVLLACLAANVFVRYFNHAGGISWVGELSVYLFPWMIAGGIVLGVQRGAHIVVDVYSARLSERWRCAFAVAVNLLVVGTYAWLFVAVRAMMELVSIETGPMLGLSLSWAYGALAYAAFGVAVCSLTIALRVLALGSGALPHADPEESPL